MSEVSEELLNAIRSLYYWQFNPDKLTYSFGDILFLLFQKADRENMERLRRGFPTHYTAYMLWYHHPSQDEFFRQYGFSVPPDRVANLNWHLYGREW